MDIYEVIKTRRSVRAYRNEPVPEEVLNRLLEAAQWAPTARNLQAWKIVVVRDAKLRAELAEAANGQMFLAEAPVVLAIVSQNPEHTMSCRVPAYAVDGAIVMDHLSLAAAAEGLGTCWIGAYSQDRAKAILGVPEAEKIVVLMPMGYPADEPGDRTRKPLGELVCYDRFE